MIELNHTPEKQEIEYKDFSKVLDTEASIKEVKSKLFKEISAMANCEGGTILIGIEDKTNEFIPQPPHIIKLLINETLGSFINDISDNFVNVSATEDNGLITVKIPPSKVLISASKDCKGINKGDIFVRINTEAKKANPKQIFQLHDKFNKLPVIEKYKIINKIVKNKFETGKNNSKSINIFDSLAITLSTKMSIIELETQFDFNMYMLFIKGLDLPLSKYTSQDMINIALHSINVNDSLDKAITLRSQCVINALFPIEGYIQSLIDGWRETAYNSESFNNYIKEYTFD